MIVVIMFAEIMQFVSHLHTGFPLMVTFHRKSSNRMAHITHVILKAGLISVIQCFLDQAHSRRRIGLSNIFLQALRNNVAYMSFIFGTLKINQVLFLLFRQSAADRGNRNVVA